MSAVDHLLDSLAEMEDVGVNQQPYGYPQKSLVGAFEETGPSRE
jgi:hypothetical protein